MALRRSSRLFAPEGLALAAQLLEQWPWELARQLLALTPVVRGLPSPLAASEELPQLFRRSVPAALALASLPLGQRRVALDATPLAQLPGEQA